MSDQLEVISKAAHNEASKVGRLPDVVGQWNARSENIPGVAGVYAHARVDDYGQDIFRHGERNVAEGPPRKDQRHSSEEARREVVWMLRATRRFLSEKRVFEQRLSG